MAKAVERLEATVRSPEGRQALGELEQARSRFDAQGQQLLQKIGAQQFDEAASFLIQEMLPQQTVYLAAIEHLVDTQVQAMEKAGADAKRMADSAALLLATLCVAAIVLAAIAARLLTRSITLPLRDAVSLAESVAAGDLTASVRAARADEAGQLLQALNRMTAQLVQVVGTVRASSDSIATGSGEIAAGNADLSQRTEQQASNLQQTAASMEQLQATVRHNADSAQRAASLAAEASAVAQTGGRSVQQMVSTMEDISARSRKIADIISVIDGIAFQTNILALNAAVEAARAGEQGRGFAVVAGEVRSLAHRSADAAKEIKSLIGSSVERVEAGQVQMAEAGAAMGDIVQRVQELAQFVRETTTAAQEQMSGIGQVNDAVSDLDRSTQQNAALVEQSAAAAESLKQQADRLVQAVSVFKLQAAVA
jgi:methyl-accepting chemotaxis protein